MNRLEEALARLERAVARLEAGAELPDAGLPGTCQTDNPELRAAADKIAERVDDALARIGRVLRGGV